MGSWFLHNSHFFLLIFTKTQAGFTKTPKIKHYCKLCFLRQEFEFFVFWRTSIQWLFQFQKMRKIVEIYVKSCTLCQMSKHNNKPMTIVRRIVNANCPNELTSVDLFGPLPVSRALGRLNPRFYCVHFPCSVFSFCIWRLIYCGGAFGACVFGTRWTHLEPALHERESNTS